MKQHVARCKGFTLIELMVTIAIAAILLVVAVPSLVTYQRNSEMTSFANTLLASINAARAEAMKRGRYAMVVPVDGASWASGWVVFVDVDRSGTFNTGDIPVQTREAPPGFLTVSGNNAANEAAPYMMFDPSGYAAKKSTSLGPRNLTLTIARNDVAASDVAEQSRLLKITLTGRARVCKPSTDATCTASAAQ